MTAAVPVTRPAVGLQMYTVREQFDADPAACLADVAAAGYTAVEFAGFGGLSAGRLRRLLDDSGLRAVSSHVDIPEFGHDLGRVVADHLELGCEYVVIQQAARDDFADPVAVADLARRCDGWGRALHDAGLRLGYHGYHDFDREFAVVDGVTMYERLVELTDPEVFDIQLDTYWVRHVGDDPVAALHRYAGRVRMLHLKETTPDGDAPIGQGDTDWPAVLAAAAATDVRWLIVEQEQHPEQAPADIRTSLRHLSALLPEHG